MTRRTPFRPALEVDQLRALADTRRTKYVYGKDVPENKRIAELRKQEFVRIMRVAEECQAIDSLDARTVLPPMPSLPIVTRDPLASALYLKLTRKPSVKRKG